MTETARGLLTGEEGKALLALMGRLRGTREALASLPISADPVKLETEVLRPLALDIRSFSLRHHLTLAQPVWPSRAVGQHGDAVLCRSPIKNPHRYVGTSCANQLWLFLISLDTSAPRPWKKQARSRQ